MKISIEGFNQAYATTLRKRVVKNGKEKEIKIDCTDLVILRWFVDFYPNMKKMEVDGVQYAWLTHKKLKEDLPIIDISKKAFIERMKKLVEFEILDYRIVKSEGTFSLYRFGRNYDNMISFKNNTVYIQTDTVSDQKDTGCMFESTQVVGLTGYGVSSRPPTKDISIKNKSIKDNYTKDNIYYNQSIYQEEDIKEQIGYETFNDDRIDEIVLLIKEILNSNKETIRINKENKSTKEVKNVFLKLNKLHIDYVLYCLDHNSTEIKNIKAYIISCLYNASFTMNSYYDAKVRHDLGY